MVCVLTTTACITQPATRSRTRIYRVRRASATACLYLPLVYNYSHIRKIVPTCSARTPSTARSTPPTVRTLYSYVEHANSCRWSCDMYCSWIANVRSVCAFATCYQYIEAVRRTATTVHTLFVLKGPFEVVNLELTRSNNAANQNTSFRLFAIGTAQWNQCFANTRHYEVEKSPGV